jgi:protein SCO1/2
VIALLLLVLVASAPAAAAPPRELASVGVDEHFGRSLPLDAALTDERGGSVRLGSFVRGDRPVLVVLAYYRCPMLCPLELRGAAEAMAGARHRLGRDFQALTLSFDPDDRPADALRMQAALGDGSAGWPFLVGGDVAVRRIVDAVGFRYRKDPDNGQYAHGALAVALTPDGRISRYLYGVPFTAAELDAALDAAASGETGVSWSTVVLQHCFRWTPAMRRYAPLLSATTRTGGGAILFGAALAVAVGVRRTRARRGRA